MKQSKHQVPTWFLTGKEELKLNIEERIAYVEKLRYFCLNRKLTNTTKGATVIAPKLKKPTGAISRVVCKVLAGGPVEVITDGLENVPDGPVIFASTHQGILDNFVWIPDCPKHCLIFHGAETNKALLMAQVNTGLILVSRDQNNVENRSNAKLDMMSVLLRGHSVYICPEGTWNLSPNRLLLPVNYGFLDVAQKTGAAVVPMIIEYTYDSTSEKERITRVHIRYGRAINVDERDKLLDKLEEYEEIVATARWELIEEKGLFKRGDITNQEYINYMKGNLKNLQLGGINIEAENKGIQGGKQEFYLFHHINNVPWDERGEWIGTEEAERLKLINLMHGI